MGTILVTSDNKLVFGKRSLSIDASKDTISVVVGYLDPHKDFVRQTTFCSDNSNKIDIFSGSRREIHEETGIQEKNIVDLVCIGIIDNKQQNQMNVPFYTKSSLII